jgi:hypothetical protein
MKKPVSAILINVVAQTVTAIELHPENTLNQLHTLIDCRTISGFDLDGYHYCYMDDEGLLSEPEGYFMLPQFTYPIAGNAVIVGTKHKTGENASVLPDLIVSLPKYLAFFRKAEVSVEAFVDLI